MASVEEGGIVRCLLRGIRSVVFFFPMVVLTHLEPFVSYARFRSPSADR